MKLYLCSFLSCFLLLLYSFFLCFFDFFTFLFKHLLTQFRSFVHLKFSFSILFLSLAAFSFCTNPLLCLSFLLPPSTLSFSSHFLISFIFSFPSFYVLRLYLSKQFGSRVVLNLSSSVMAICLEHYEQEFHCFQLPNKQTDPCSWCSVRETADCIERLCLLKS